MPLVTTCGVYSPAIGSTSLPAILVWMSRRRRMVLSACSMNSGWPSSTIRIAFLPAAKVGDLVVDQRIGDVEAIDRHRGLAVDVGEAELLQRAHAPNCTCRPGR